MTDPPPGSTPGAAPDPLDNAVWHALHGPRAAFAEVEPSGLAVRFDPEVSVFAAIPDAPGTEAWAALARLVGPGGTARTFRAPMAVPDGWVLEQRYEGVQLVGPSGLGAPCPEAVVLGPGDVPEMQALVAATEPGPFTARTIELGTYLGIRRQGRLVAMAGERLRLPGRTELSAVCTAPDHRRQGLAEALVRDLLVRIDARGEQPFLHTGAENAGAIALYERLGFTLRTAIDVLVLIAPTA